MGKLAPAQKCSASRQRGVNHLGSHRNRGLSAATHNADECRPRAAVDYGAVDEGRFQLLGLRRYVNEDESTVFHRYGFNSKQIGRGIQAFA
jgi:hypothetical protein